MRIAFLCTSSIDDPSPRGRWLPLAKALTKDGHEIHLLMLHPEFDALPGLAVPQVFDGVHIHHVAQMHVHGPASDRRYFPAAQLALIVFRGILALFRACRRIHPDIIHICKPQPINGAAGRLAAWSLGLPYYLDCDDLEAEANQFSTGAFGKIQRSLVSWFEDNLPRKARGITVNTRFLEDRCASLGVAKDHLWLVPNGIDPNVIPHATCLPGKLVEQYPGASWVAYIGAMSTAAHAPDLLVEAFSLAAQQHSTARLMMIGEGPDKEKLMQMGQRLGVADRIDWIGWVAPNEVWSYYRLAKCSVDPVYPSRGAASRSPLKIIESLAVGTPVVTGDVGDRYTTVGDAGLVVQPGDPAALAQAIVQMMQPGTSELYGARARGQAKRGDWATLAKTWLKCYSPTT